MQITEIINSIPEFMWNNIFSVISTLGCGLIVAFFTSTFLKKKEERTRIAGVIVEKRINSEQEILHFLESELFKQEINMDNSSKDDYLFDELLKQFELPVPYDGHMQYARVFTNPKLFEDFFHKFEEQIMNHKLWLDTKVKEHLVFMQIYFSFFNTIPLMIKRIPLPRGQELTDEEFEHVHKVLLLMLGHCCDNEINALMSELDDKIVDSVYKLELSRPKKSMMRDNMYNVDMKRCLKRFEKKTIPGTNREGIYGLIMAAVYQKKGIDKDSMTNEEYDEFLKSSMPRDYDHMKAEFEEFKKGVEKIAEESGVKIVSKKDLDKYPGVYAVSLRDALEGKEPEKVDGKKGTTNHKCDG